MNFLSLHNVIPVKLGTCCYKFLHFHELAIVWLMFSLLFISKTDSFVTNKCVLWLQSKSCFTVNFCYLTLSSMY